MLRSLYAYKGTHARTLGFQAGEKFLEISQSRDPNWLHVISERGALGYVPKNYVALEECPPEDMLEFIDGSIEATHLNASERGGSYSRSEHEALHKLVEIRQEWYSKAPASSQHPSKRPAPPPPQRTSSQLSVDSVGSPSGGQASPSGGSSPRPPSITSFSSLTASSSNLSLGAPPVREPTPVQDESSGSSEGHDTSIGYESELRSDVDSNVQTSLKSLVSQVPPDYLRTLVENVRSQTSVSYATSHQVVEIVLKSLSSTLSSLQPLCSHILQGKTNEVSVEHNSGNNASSWQRSSDGRTLVELLERLREHKDDDQQRSWALHEDEYTISQHLNALLDLLNNGDLVACRSVLELDDFRPLLTLVQYYQMETRWPLRKLLLQVFGAVCQMAAANISYLSASVLPVEFTRQLVDGCSDNEEVLQYTALVLGMVLCMGDTLPYTHFSVMNSKFIEVLLCGIEKYCEDPDTEQLGELYLTLVFAFNLQYTVEGISKEESAGDSDSENLVLKHLSRRKSTKYFTEKLLLLFNREEDPLAMFEHSPRPIHSVLKMMLDVYSNPVTSLMIYTNDERVVCDILVRQLSDLPPDDKHRYLYLCLLEGVIMQGGWQEHQHRQTELLRCCNNILAEDEEISSKKDKDIINRIYQKCPLILG